jgi:hypothetical protein
MSNLDLILRHIEKHMDLYLLEHDLPSTPNTRYDAAAHLWNTIMTELYEELPGPFRTAYLGVLSTIMVAEAQTALSNLN